MRLLILISTRTKTSSTKTFKVVQLLSEKTDSGKTQISSTTTVSNADIPTCDNWYRLWCYNGDEALVCTCRSQLKNVSTVFLIGSFGKPRPLAVSDI